MKIYKVIVSNGEKEIFKNIDEAKLCALQTIEDYTKGKIIVQTDDGFTDLNYFDILKKNFNNKNIDIYSFWGILLWDDEPIEIKIQIIED